MSEQKFAKPIAPKVTLINYTRDAMETLIFTKATRLTMSPGLFDEIKSWPMEKKLEELAYMANTLPSSWEFVDYIFLVEGVSRAYTHQQVRTRTASYAQQAMRVVNLQEGFDYIMTARTAAKPEAVAIVEDVCAKILDGYGQLLDVGLLPEDARGVLPTNVSTNICCKFNLRGFSDLVKARSGGRSQSEYQSVVKGMADAVLAVHPWAEAFLFQHGRDFFNDIEAFAEREFGDNLGKKGDLLKIVDKMRKAWK